MRLDLKTTAARTRLPLAFPGALRRGRREAGRPAEEMSSEPLPSWRIYSGGSDVQKSRAFTRSGGAVPVLSPAQDECCMEAGLGRDHIATEP
jgi:hypothetical protein